VDPKRGIKNWKIYNGVNFVFVFSGMALFFVFSYEIVSYFNPTNRYVLSSLLEVAVFVPVLLAISIPLKQLVLGYNYKNFYVSLTSIMVVFNLLAIVVYYPLSSIWRILFFNCYRFNHYNFLSLST